MAGIMFIINLIVNWAAVGALVAVIWILCTNTLQWLPIILITSVIACSIAAFFLSSWGDKLIRKSYRPLSRKEQNYITPIFTDIFNKTNLKTPPVLLMSDDPRPNGMVIGNNTMVLTRGLLAECSQKEIAAVIAHEFGHIVNGDAQKKWAEYSINRAGDLTLGIAAGIMLLISDNGQRLIFFPFVAIAVVLKIVRNLFARIMLFGFLAIDRKNEYKADAFVKELGLSEHLASYLSKIEDTPTLIINRTHPYKKDRIRKLQCYT